jgi:hypothetical protein
VSDGEQSGDFRCFGVPDEARIMLPPSQAAAQAILSGPPVDTSDDRTELVGVTHFDFLPK